MSCSCDFQVGRSSRSRPFLLCRMQFLLCRKQLIAPNLGVNIETLLNLPRVQQAAILNSLIPLCRLSITIPHTCSVRMTSAQICLAYKALGLHRLLAVHHIWILCMINVLPRNGQIYPTLHHHSIWIRTRHPRAPTLHQRNIWVRTRRPRVSHLLRCKTVHCH